MQFLVEVNYKSGISRQFWCEEFNFTKNLDGSKSFRWTSVPNKPQPIMLGIDDIESLWVIETLDT